MGSGDQLVIVWAWFREERRMALVGIGTGRPLPGSMAGVWR